MSTSQCMTFGIFHIAQLPYGIGGQCCCMSCLFCYVFVWGVGAIDLLGVVLNTHLTPLPKCVAEPFHM